MTKTKISIKKRPEGKKEEPKPECKGTRYSCKYSTIQKKAGTTYSPKW